MKMDNEIMEENLKNMYDDYSKILEQKDQRIADLEAKLESSKKSIIELSNICDEWADKYLKIEAKLAESEKIIEAQHNGIEYWKSVAEKRPDFDCVVKIKELEQQLEESKKKASRNYQEGYDLYLSLKQFYSRLGVEAYADDEIQDVAVKELNRLLNENEELKQQLAEKVEFGKFKSAEELLKAYQTLEREFTKSRQQLVEKEKEIEELKKGVYKVTLGTISSNQIDFTENFYIIQNQTAIAELEKVRKMVDELLDNCGDKQYKVWELFDQQIAELKGGK